LTLTPFKGKPLVELHPNKFFRSDVGFLVEKCTPVFIGLFSIASRTVKPLFQAWGILFEEYVNWFLRDRKYSTPMTFLKLQSGTDGSESFDGAFMQDTRSCLWKYKGKVLKLEAALFRRCHCV